MTESLKKYDEAYWFARRRAERLRSPESSLPPLCKRFRCHWGIGQFVGYPLAVNQESLVLGCTPFFKVLPSLGDTNDELRVAFLEPRTVNIEIGSRPWELPSWEVGQLFAVRLHVFLSRPNLAWEGCTNWQAAIIAYDNANHGDAAPEGGFRALTSELMGREPEKFKGCLPIDLPMPDYVHLLPGSHVIEIRVPLPDGAVMAAHDEALGLTLAVEPSWDEAGLPEFILINGSYGEPTCRVWRLSFNGERCVSEAGSCGLDADAKGALTELLRRKVGPYSNWERLIDEWNVANRRVRVTDTHGDEYEVCRRGDDELLPPNMPMPDFTKL